MYPRNKRGGTGAAEKAQKMEDNEKKRRGNSKTLSNF